VILTSPHPRTAGVDGYGLGGGRITTHQAYSVASVLLSFHLILVFRQHSTSPLGGTKYHETARFGGVVAPPCDVRCDVLYAVSPLGIDLSRRKDAARHGDDDG
jgi:hypothetical protein